MTKKTWADVKKLDVVELNGRPWTVEKIKPHGKKADVRVRYKSRTGQDTVKLRDRVKIVGHASVQDETGTQQRWATKRELAEALEPKGLDRGNAKVKKPPHKPAGGSWEKPVGAVEKRVVNLLEARLVAETDDEAAGYYVPPADVTTIAAHLALMHGGIPSACDDDEAAMLKAHAAQHAAALEGSPLPVNHWHTAKRP